MTHPLAGPGPSSAFFRLAYRTGIRAVALLLGVLAVMLLSDAALAQTLSATVTGPVTVDVNKSASFTVSVTASCPAPVVTCALLGDNGSSFPPQRTLTNAVTWTADPSNAFSAKTTNLSITSPTGGQSSVDLASSVTGQIKVTAMVTASIRYCSNVEVCTTSPANASPDLTVTILPPPSVPSITAVPPTSISIRTNKTSPSLEVKTIPGGLAIAWELDPTPGIVFVTKETPSNPQGSAQATVRASAAGTYTVKASITAEGCNPCSASFEVKVSDLPMISAVPPASLMASLNKPVTLTVSVNNSPSKSVGWRVNPNSGASVKSSTTDVPSSGSGTFSGNSSNAFTATATGRFQVTARLQTSECAGSCAATFTIEVPSVVIQIASGNNQTGVINAALPAPLEVKITQNGSSGIAAVPIAWQVTSGSGVLGKKDPTPTDANGLASNTLTLGNSAAQIVVTASALGVEVKFTVNNATTTATQSIKAFQVLGNAALLTSTTQATNIGIRLGALRKGAAGVNVSGFSLDVDGQSIPIGAVASLVPGLGGGASADQLSLFSKLGIFLNGQGSLGDQQATSNQPGFDFHTAGVTLGVDYRFTPEFVLGTAAGYNSTKQALDASAGDFKTQGISWSAFGSYYIGEQFYVDGIATYSWNQFDTARNITSDDTTAVASGDTHGNQFAISVGTGYDFRLGRLTLGIQGRVNYINVDIDSLKESGAGIYDLNIKSQNIQSLTTFLGPQVSYNFNLPWAILSPTVKAEWVHEFLNNSRAVQGALMADPSATVFSFQTDNPVRNYMNLGVGLTATFKHGISAFFYYQGILGYSNFTSNSFTAGIRVEF